MSPFADTFYEIRMRYGVRQTELAEMLGYEQTYISAIEVDKKGPPSEAFIQRLVQKLDLTEIEANQLFTAAKASKRKLTLNKGLHQDVYWMVHDMRERLPELSAVQIQLIRQILGLKDSLPQEAIEVIRPLKRRRNQEAKM